MPRLSPIQKAALHFVGVLAALYALAALSGEGRGSLLLALALATYAAVMGYAKAKAGSQLPFPSLNRVHPDVAALLMSIPGALWMMGGFAWLGFFQLRPWAWVASAVFWGALMFLTLRDRRWRLRGVTDYPLRGLTDDRWMMLGIVAFAVFTVVRLIQVRPDAAALAWFGIAGAIIAGAAVVVARELRKAREKWEPRPR